MVNMGNIKRLLRVLPLIFAGIVFIPWYPVFDPMFVEQQLHWAYAGHWQYGRDIMLPYGPLGFLGLPFYCPQTFAALVVAHLFIFGVTAYFIKVFWTELSPNISFPLLRLSLVIILSSLSPACEWSGMLSLPFLLLTIFVLLHFFVENHFETTAKYVLAGILGIFGLIKVVFLPIMLLGVGIVALDESIRQRRIPRTFLVYASTTLVLWFLSGQHFDNMLPFLKGSMEILLGYRDAASLWSKQSTVFAAMFIAAIVLLTAEIFRTSRQAIKLIAILPTAVLATVNYTMFSHGFVRADNSHMIVAFLNFLSLFILLWPWLRKDYVNSRQRCHLLALLISCSFILVPLLITLNSSRELLRPLVSGPISLVNLIWHGPGELQRKYYQELARLEKYPIPTIKSPVDMPSGNPGIIISHNAEFRPRPTLVSYAATTPWLAHLNRVFLEADSGPETIFFMPTAIDNNYPTMLDNYSFLSLATHFELQDSSGLYLIFKRREKPLSLKLTHVSTHVVRFGEEVSLEHIQPTIVWATITVRPNYVGRFFNQIFKPFPVSMVVSLDNKMIQHRLVPQMASSGFVLSPYLNEMSSLHAFYELKEPQTFLPKVNSITIPLWQTSFGSSILFYVNQIEIKLYQVSIHASSN